jgi:hypothetical protein
MPRDLRTDETTPGGIDEFSGTRALATGGTRGCRACDGRAPARRRRDGRSRGPLNALEASAIE